MDPIVGEVGEGDENMEEMTDHERKEEKEGTEEEMEEGEEQQEVDTVMEGEDVEEAGTRTPVSSTPRALRTRWRASWTLRRRRSC